MNTNTSDITSPIAFDITSENTSDNTSSIAFDNTRTDVSRTDVSRTDVCKPEVCSSSRKVGKKYSMIEITDAMARARDLANELAVLYEELKNAC